MILVNYKNLKERLINNFPSLSLITIKNYCSQLNKVKNLDISKPREIENKLFDKYKITTYKQLIISIIKYLKINEKKNDDLIYEYLNYMDDIQEIIYDDKDHNQKNEKEKENWATLKQIKKVFYNLEDEIYKYDFLMTKYDSLNKIEQNIMTDFILLGLFVLNPPRRANDYSCMLIQDIKNKTFDKDFNYLIIENKKAKYFIFNNYKTKKIYKSQKIEISVHLSNILNKYLKILNHNIKPLYLLKINDKKLNSNLITKRIKRIFLKSYLQKPININLIRHIFISEIIGEEEISLHKFRKKISYSMAHSSSMQIQYIKY
tara:strand:+ start:545 stop:1498 length:954 start_codon:yes stop_codon:yes gene_type:complete